MATTDALKSGLIVVDVQRDFCEGGALPAVDTLSLIPPLRDFIETVRRNGILIIFTQDWHPTDHTSFTTNGGEWPVHCVLKTVGAELMPSLTPQGQDWLIKKGTARDRKGYSAFESTDLAAMLNAEHINSVGICGIATDYCVSATAQDAFKEGLKTTILTDLIRPVDPTKANNILNALQINGIDVVESSVWLIEQSTFHKMSIGIKS